MKLDFIDWLLVIFGLFLAYQLLRAILGGSWQTEGLIITLLLFNLGMTWKLSMKFEGHIG